MLLIRKRTSKSNRLGKLTFKTRYFSEKVRSRIFFGFPESRSPQREASRTKVLREEGERTAIPSEKGKTKEREEQRKRSH